MNTKERLLSSALTLFSQKGFQATSTTSICANAGFSSGALFVHFKTKNELLDTLYLNIKKEYFLHANAGLEEYTDIFEIAQHTLLRGAEYYIQNPEKFTFMKRFMNSPHIGRIAQSEIEQEMQGMSVLLDIGKKQGRVIGLDNHLIFQMLAGASYNLIDYAIQTDTKIIGDHIQIILNMVKTKEDEFFSQIAHERIYLS